MKKVLVAFSLICFVAVNAVNAQSPAASANETKSEASATPSAVMAKENPAASVKEAGHPACCQKSAAATKACCKAGGDMKACSPAERAKCAEKMKAEAAVDSKPNTEAEKN